jgi:hypothetical protein
VKSEFRLIHQLGRRLPRDRQAMVVSRHPAARAVALYVPNRAAEVGLFFCPREVARCWAGSS